MAWISKADYETVTVTCEYCGANCIFNRREDFPYEGPYAGENVACASCGREFRMVGDTLNAPYELFIVAAREYFNGKRYMLAVASMAQAWELFFSTFAGARYLYRPFFSLEEDERDIDKLNALQVQMEQTIRRFTFAPLRNLLINTVVQRVDPRTLDEAALAVDRIASAGLGNDTPQADLSSTTDPDTRQILEDLLALSIGQLRNKVLHHRAYRPLRAEVEKCLEHELRVLYRAKQALGVWTFDEFAAGNVQEMPRGRTVT